MLKREDIYRQRVFGNNSGAKQFIITEERRKVKSYWLLLYLIFILATSQYVFYRLHITSEYNVYEAIRRPLEETVFTSAPEPRRWKHIDTMEDVKLWLLNAFPDVMTPDIQHFNIPLGQIRFTMRRMQMENNTDKRFNDYFAYLWKNPSGISTEDKTSADDDTSPFGAYRVWANVSLDWPYERKDDWRCPPNSVWIDTVDFPDSMEAIQVEKRCRQWCEGLVRPLTCHCFEQSSANSRCDFYEVPENAWCEFYGVADGTPNSDADCETIKNTFTPTSSTLKASVILPKAVREPKKGLSAMFPMTKKFAFQDTQRGYRKTPGFVQYLSYYSQEELTSLAVAEGITASAPQRVMSGEIEDWIAGGYLGKHTVTLAIDFATYNPNYDMFSWVNLELMSTPAGYVKTGIHIYSINIQPEDLEKKWSIGDELTRFWELVYLGLVAFYCACEVWEMTCCAKGLKYFTSGWNWLTLLHLLLNVVSIVLWLSYKGQTEFMQELIEMRDMTNPEFTPKNLVSFATQVSKYTLFRYCAAFNMLFVAMQLLQYLNDIYPKVTVLIETVTNSFVPIFFFTLVCCVIIFGTIMWTFVWFGRRIQAFSSFKDTVVTVVAMAVGEFSEFNDVRDEFGTGAFLFYIPYQLFMIIVILNFPRAVLIAGYEDASLKHEEDQKHQQKRLAAKESTGGAGTFWMIKYARMKLKALFPEELNAKHLVERMKGNKSMALAHKKSNFVMYIVFCILYTLMCIMIMRTTDAYDLTHAVNTVIKTPTFGKVNVITGEAIRGSNFDSIATRSDVATWISQVLPEVLYSTSSGTFDGAQNPLLNYSTAPTNQQLILRNWNIMVGQEPARITAKLSKMKTLGDDAIKGVMQRSYLIRESNKNGVQSEVLYTGLPDEQFVPAESMADVSFQDNETKDAVANYCNYSFGYGAEDLGPEYTTKNGFVCMLSVDRTRTELVLDAVAAGLISRQTVALTIEFVLYNAWAETFLYVVVQFAFQPNGIISKDVQVEPVNLELHEGITGILLFILEIAVMITNLYYLGQNLWELIKAMLRGWQEGSISGKKPEQVRTRKSAFQAMFTEFLYFFLLDGFNALDCMSCLATLVTWIMFFNYTNSQLARNYYFQEKPIWIPGKCISNNFNWCNDSEVITQFFMAKTAFRTFARVMAMNTIAVFARLLRYLKTFEHMRVIFATMMKGLYDILWFVVIFIVALCGYMLMGYCVFGANSGNFKTPWSSLRACFEIFLGKFNSTAMAEASLWIMIIYVLTYWFVFKLIVVNMFLAIIDKNYKELDADRIKQAEAKREASALQRMGFGRAQELAGQMKNLFKKGKSSEKKEEAPATAVQPEPAAESAAPETPAENGVKAAEIQDEMKAAATEASGVTEAGTKEEGAAPEFQGTEPRVFVREDVKNVYWNQLPEEVKEWSLDKANEINKTLLHDLIESRLRIVEAQNGADLEDSCLQPAETKIGEMKRAWGKMAAEEKQRLDTEELAELRRVHQDQESLSWYIMKRDAELKKLESAKDLKQDRFDKMVKAANSLIKPEDEAAASGDQLSLMNNR
jgi:hypothetical protein